MGKSKTERICVAFDSIAKLSIVLGTAPLNKVKDCWECRIDKHWWIAVNGHKETVKTSKGIEIPAFNCYVEFNGFPAGIFSPINGGFLAAGELANEDTFIKAIEDKIQGLNKCLN